MFLILRTGSGVGFEAGDHDNRLALESCDEIAVGPHQWRHHQRERRTNRDCELVTSENSFWEIAGLFRMAPRGHVQTLTPRT